MSETSAEIRARRQREFDAKMMQGTPIDMRGVLPANVIAIGELRADLKKSRQSNFNLIAELVESETQIRWHQKTIKKLQFLVEQWEKLDGGN